MLESWLGVFGRLHPFVNHLPIGMLLALLLLEIVAAAIASPLPRRVISGLAWLTAISAVLSALAGYVLSRETGYGGETIALHMRLGIAVASLSLVLAIIHLRAREGTRERALKWYRGILVFTALLLLPTGHLGGTITHGEGFLVEPLRAPLREKGKDGSAAAGAPSVVEAAGSSTSTATSSAEAPAVSYLRDVAPIFAARCSACHGESKRKGGLSLADPEAILEGGWDGPVISTESPGESEILRRLRLPIDDEDHMPPESKPQPTPEEIAVLEEWITAGAAFDAGTVPEAAVAERPEVSKVEPVVAAPREEPGAGEAALAALREKLVHVEPVTKGSSLLWVDFAAAARTTGDAEATALLEPVLAYVADLSLSRSRITDETMKLVARMTNLSRLDLRGTAVTDAGVAALAGHEKLTELVLPQTRLSDGAVEHLLELPALRKVYLWNSGVGTRGLAKLRLGGSDLVIEAGDAGEARPLETEGAVVLKKPQPPSDEPGPPAAALNAVCPVSDKPVDPAYQVVFRGRVIGFCCPNCPAQFWADPEKYVSKLK